MDFNWQFLHTLLTLLHLNVVILWWNHYEIIPEIWNLIIWNSPTGAAYEGISLMLSWFPVKIILSSYLIYEINITHLSFPVPKNKSEECISCHVVRLIDGSNNPSLNRFAQYSRNMLLMRVWQTDYSLMITFCTVSSFQFCECEHDIIKTE